MVSAREQSEMVAPTGPAINTDFIRRLSRTHEATGFDRVLVRTSSSNPDPIVLAAQVLSHTERLGVLIAHRPGFVAPTVAARALATLDQVSEGRVATHIVAGGDSRDLARDGDILGHDERYDRAEEFVTILRRAWTKTGPFDFTGRYYRIVDYRPPFHCHRQPHVPVYVGGASDRAVEFAARCADVMASWGEPLADIAAHVATANTAARRYGRCLRHSLSVRPILAPREEVAWDRAYQVLTAVQSRGLHRPATEVENVGSRRLLGLADRGDILDRCLFTPLVEATGARGNATALVGTVETVADALVAYTRVGISTFIIAGFGFAGIQTEVASFTDLIQQVHHQLHP